MPPATITTKLLCRFCGYDLRELPVDGRCPECGNAISDSRKARWADDAWIRVVEIGVRLLAIGMILYVVTFVAAVGISPAVIVIFPLAAIVTTLGALRIATPRAHARSRAVVSSAVVHTLSWISGGAQVLTFFLALIDRVDLRSVSLMFYLWALATGAIYAQIAYIARQLKMTGFFVQAMILGVLGGTSLATVTRVMEIFGRYDHPFIRINIACIAIAALWGIVFLGAFAFQLHKKRRALQEDLRNEAANDSSSHAIDERAPAAGG